MHELSIVQSLIEEIESIRMKHNLSKINNVTVSVGKFSGVVMDSFCFAFETLKVGLDSLKDTSLTVETTDNTIYCPQCNFKIDEDFYDIFCPMCNTPVSSPNSGDVILKSIEME